MPWFDNLDTTNTTHTKNLEQLDRKTSTKSVKKNDMFKLMDILRCGAYTHHDLNHNRKWSIYHQIGLTSLLPLSFQTSFMCCIFAYRLSYRTSCLMSITKKYIMEKRWKKSRFKSYFLMKKGYNTINLFYEKSLIWNDICAQKCKK